MTAFRKLVDTVQVGSLYLLFILLPFSKAAIEISFGFLFLTWLFQRMDPATRHETFWATPGAFRLRWALVAYLTVCALSIVISSVPALSVKGFIGKWLEYLLYFAVAVDLGRRPGIVRNVIAAIAISTGFVAVDALTQELFGRGLLAGHSYRNYQRAIGPYENPIDLATYLMVVIPLLAMAAIQRKRGMLKAVLVGLLVYLAIMFARTDALGAWLGLGLGLLVILLERPAARRYGLIALVGLVLFCGFVPQGKGQGSPGHLREAFALGRWGTTDRWNMWQAALGMIRDRPILGQGVNTFMANYLRFWVGGERQPRYAHNCYLQIAAETGLLGLAAFVGLLWLMCRRWLAALRQGSRSEEHLALIGFAIGLFAFAFQSGIDTNFYSLRQAALFWVLAGLATGLSERVAPR